MLYDAREKYKSMFRRCRNHGFKDLFEIHIFINGILQESKLLLDAMQVIH